MIKVLHISHYPTMKMGGQQSMAQMIKHFDSKKVKSFAIVPKKGELSEYLEAIGCKCFFVEVPHFKLKNIFLFFKAKKQIREIIKTLDIDIIHCDTERDAVIAGRAKKRTKAKLIWHIRLTSTNHLDKFIFQKADAYIGISAATKNRLPEEEFSKFHLIYNGCDISRFIPINDKFGLKKEIDFPNTYFDILFVGQIKIGKGIFDLIEAVKILDESKKDFSLSIVGDYLDIQVKNDLEALINNYKFKNNRIRFFGQQKAIEKFMQVADVLVLPSHEGIEGMGRVLFESMACGTPVIATDISGVNEAVTISTGILVPPHSPEKLASALMKMIAKPDIVYRMKDSARKRAIEHFDIQTHSEKITKLYWDLIHDRR